MQNTVHVYTCMYMCLSWERVSNFSGILDPLLPKLSWSQLGIYLIDSLDTDKHLLIVSNFITTKEVQLIVVPQSPEQRWSFHVTRGGHHQGTGWALVSAVDTEPCSCKRLGTACGWEGMMAPVHTLPESVTPGTGRTSGRCPKRKRLCPRFGFLAAGP